MPSAPAANTKTAKLDEAIKVKGENAEVSFPDTAYSLPIIYSLTGKKMETGEMVPMCGMCMSMGGLMMKGAKFDAVETSVFRNETRGSLLPHSGNSREVVRPQPIS